MKKGAFLVSVVGNTGNGGNVTVKAERLEVLDGAVIGTFTEGPGHGGTLEVRADEVLLSGANAGLLAVSEGTGNAGQVRLTAKRVQILDGAGISTETNGPGQGGNIEVQADEVLLSGANAPGCCTGVFAGQHSPSGTGHAGQVRLTMKSLQIVDGAMISTQTEGPGREETSR